MATIARTRNEVVFGRKHLPVNVTGMQSMAGKMWIPFIAMGFMIVAVSLIVGLVVSATAADYFTASKEVREAAAKGSDLATQRAFIEATKAWLPSFKFLGLGMLLGGVTFLLATILGALRVGGGRVQEALGVEVKLIRPPVTARIFPAVMMMGTMVLMVAVVIGIFLATQTYGYWNHSIATELNPAGAGSFLLAELGTINAIKLWLEPLKFVGIALLLSGIALLLSGIGLALATIVRVLRWQANRLWEILS